MIVALNNSTSESPRQEGLGTFCNRGKEVGVACWVLPEKIRRGKEKRTVQDLSLTC